MVAINFLNSIGIVLSLILSIACGIAVVFLKTKIKNSVGLKNMYGIEYLKSKIVFNINLALFILFYINSTGNILIIFAGIIAMYVLLIYSFLLLYICRKYNNKKLYLI